MEDCQQGKIPSGLDFVNFSLTVPLINVKLLRFRHLGLQISFGGKLSRFLTWCFPTVAPWWWCAGMSGPGAAQVPLEVPLQLYEDVRVTDWNVTENWKTGKLCNLMRFLDLYIIYSPGSNSLLWLTATVQIAILTNIELTERTETNLTQKIPVKDSVVFRVFYSPVNSI